MRRQQEHRQQGIFVAEGEKVVRRLLESKFTVVSVLLPEKWLRELEPLLQARQEDIRVLRGGKGTAGDSHRLLDVPGPARRREGAAPAITGRGCGAQPPAPALDGGGWSHNAEDLGALVRNCAAFNAQARSSAKR